MTVDQLVEELKEMQRLGYGQKEAKVYGTREPSGDAFTRPIFSVNYITMRHYARDIVEIV